MFIHPGDGPHPTRWASEALGDTVGQPAETAVALTDLIFTGVLDRFITALPLRPNRQVQQEFAGCAPDVRDIGDAPEPGLIFHAIRAGAAAGREI